MQETILQINSWTIRTRQPDAPGPHPVLLLLHGWTGDENSMWFFAPRLPERFLLLAPRAIYATPPQGYSWRRIGEQIPAPGMPAFPQLNEFRESVAALNELLTPENFPTADFSRVHLMGFSQGAAVSYAFALLHPARVAALAALAGFVPEGAEPLVKARPLVDKPVLIAHGRRDEMIPIEHARRAFDLMQQAGAQVSTCEDDVGHKLGARCFPSLEAFFETV